MSQVCVECLLCVCCVDRLVYQAPGEMSQVCVEWSTLIYPLLLHLNPKLRERAVVAMDTLLPVMMSQQMEVAKCLASDLKDVRPPALIMSRVQPNSLFYSRDIFHEIRRHP